MCVCVCVCVCVLGHFSVHSTSILTVWGESGLGRLKLGPGRNSDPGMGRFRPGGLGLGGFRPRETQAGLGLQRLRTVRTVGLGGTQVQGDSGPPYVLLLLRQNEY